MAQDIPEKLIVQLAELIKSHIGLDYPKDRWRDLMRNMEFVAKELGFEDVASCVDSLLSAPLREKEMEALIQDAAIRSQCRSARQKKPWGLHQEASSSLPGEFSRAYPLPRCCSWCGFRPAPPAARMPSSICPSPGRWRASHGAPRCRCRGPRNASRCP